MESGKIKKQLIDYKISRRNLFLYVKYKDFNNKNEFLDKIAGLIISGIDGIELDGEGLSDGEFLDLAKKTEQLCAQYDVTFIIKNRVDIAYLSSADGVNLEQDCLDIASAREIIGGEKIVGLYITSLEALDLVKDGADYISVRQISSTPTEPVMSTGLEYAKWVSEKTLLPVIVVCNIDNIPSLTTAHKNLRVAIDNSIFNYSSPNTVTENLLNEFKK